MDKCNIVLCGFMASGKTTVGRLLSETTGLPLADTDAIVEQEAGMPVSEIFASGGEKRFRELERKVVAAVSARAGVVIAAGGGAVLDRRNVTELKKLGVVYFLDVTPTEVVRRVGTDASRPILPGDVSDIESLMGERATAYDEAVDVFVSTTGRDPREVALQIASDFECRRQGV